MNLIDAMNDPALFAPWFKHRDSWIAWRAFIAAVFCIQMSPAQRRFFRECTGRQWEPDKPVHEAWLICGRRAGKSFMMALIAVYLACFKDWRPFLSSGERGTIVIIAADRRQARTILRYVKGFLTGIPMLKRLIERETREAFDLSNSITIEVHTCSFRTVRGYTIIAALCDEIAFWISDETSANPATEVITALRPAMATIPEALLIGASTPYAQSGPLFNAHQRHYGKENSPVLVWQAETRKMNPTVRQSVIDEAYAADPASAASEYGALWRVDVEQLLTREAVTACVAPGIRERPPGFHQYVGFIDPAGGSGTDSMTLAIAHREDERAILDCLRERKPKFSPDAVVTEFVDTLKSYRVTRVVGDRYAGEFCREPFRRLGIDYWLSDKAKSDLYLDCLPAINSGNLVLLDHDRLLNQFCSLERRTARSGKDSIDHAPGGHDDLCNVVAGATQLVLVKPRDEAMPAAPVFVPLDRAEGDRDIPFADLNRGADEGKDWAVSFVS